MREGMPVYCELTDGHGYGAEFVMEAEAARETASKKPNLLGVIYSDIYLAAANAALSHEDKAIACIASALERMP